MATATQLDPQTLVVQREAYGSPFAGMTLGQARVMNVALRGLPVEVYGGKSSMGPEVFIFDAIRVPGGYGGVFEVAGDLILTHAERAVDGETWIPRVGSQRVLSAQLVRRFDVLAIETRFRVCSVCGRPLPLTEKVHDIGGLGRRPDGTMFLLPDGEPEWIPRFECVACWHGPW